MELNAEELTRVQDAIARGRELELYDPLYRRIMKKNLGRNLPKLAALWRSMSEEELDLIRLGLAQKAGLLERPDVLDPWILDVGAVAAEHLEGCKGVRGEAVEIPGLRAAVRELWSIWKDPSVWKRPSIDRSFVLGSRHRGKSFVCCHKGSDTRADVEVLAGIVPSVSPE